MTREEALAEFLAPPEVAIEEPFEPFVLTDAMALREDTFELLVGWRSEELGRPIHVDEGEMYEVLEILRDHVSDEEVVSLSVEELAAVAAKMAAEADVDGEYDDHGLGHAWVVPGMTFAQARQALRRRPKRAIKPVARTRRGPVRALRSSSRGGHRRVARVCSTGPPGRPRLEDDDDPHDDVVPRRMVAA